MKCELDFIEIGNRIQYYRTQNNMTQAQLVELIGTNQKHISKIEAGQLRVKLDTMYAITTALHISIDTLIADYDNSNDEANLKLILDEIRGMNHKQLKMLRENIATIKKFNQ